MNTTEESLFEKLLVVQMPPLYIKLKLERSKAEAREDAEAETRRSAKEVAKRETQRKFAE